MSLRLAALQSLIAFERLYAGDWAISDNRLITEYSATSHARNCLGTALGIAPIYAEHDADLTPIGLLETLAESLARDDATKLLAGAVQAALREHNRGALATQMLAAAE